MKISCAVFLCLFFGAAVLADMTVVQKLKSDLMPNAKQDSSMTMTVKGQKARIDLPASRMSSIIDLQKGKMYTLDCRQKQVMVMSLDDIKKAADLTGQSKGGQAKSTVTKTGKIETIQGYKCAQYKIVGTGENPATINCWVTEDVDDAEMEPFRAVGGRMGGFLGLEGVQKPKGMMIRSESKMNLAGRDVTSASEVQSIKREPVADSVFAIPADYKIMEMPAFNPPPKPGGVQ